MSNYFLTNRNYFLGVLLLSLISLQTAVLAMDPDPKGKAEEAAPLDDVAQKDSLLYIVERSFSSGTQLGVKQNEKIIGCVAFYGLNYCYIGRLWVDQAFRGKGLGTALLNLAIKSLENDAGCHKIYLMASPFSLKEGEEFEPTLKILKKYYERFGFKECSKGSDYMKRSSKKPMS